MTSWVWMKGIDVAIADPCEPVTPEDKRKSVKELIEEHRSKIDKVTAEVSKDPLYDASKHDDLWILRFLLSHKKSQAAIKAAKSTLLFRKKHKLDDKDIRDHIVHESKEDSVNEYWKTRCNGDALLFTLPDKKRGVIAFIDFGSLDHHKAAKELSVETWDHAFIYSSEWCHQWLDYVTRSTGRLTRSVRFVDASSLSLKALNREANKRDGKIMGEMEDCYPQMLETLFLCNAPSWIHLVWQIMRPIMPKRILDKIDIITPTKNEKERHRLWQHISEDNLPDYHGGKNDVPPAKWKW